MAPSCRTSSDGRRAGRRPVIAIVGASLRGVLTLLELGRVLPATADPIDVVVIDPEVPGPGRLWRTDQPTALVMNTLADQCSVFADHAEGPSLYRWWQVIGGQDSGADLPAAMLRSACELAEPEAHWSTIGRYDYAPRSVFGRYLQWAFAYAVGVLQGRATVRTLRTEVVDLDPTSSETVRVEVRDGEAVGAAVALLCVGWGRPARPAPRLRHPHVGPDSPIDQELSHIDPGDHIFVRGLGMSFFDTTVMLTLGRGGSFEGDPLELRYRPSGAEPVIHVGSRRGIPFRSQPRWSTLEPPCPELVATERAILALRGRPASFRGIRAAVDVDAACAYYRALAPGLSATEAERLEAALVRAAADADTAMAFLADAARIADVEPYVPGLLACERPGTFASAEEYRRWFAGAVEQDLRLGDRSPLHPLKAAALVYVASRSLMSSVAGFGRLDVGSEREFAEYMRFVGLTGGVPPWFRSAQLLALLRSGVVRPIGPLAEAIETGTRLVARSAVVVGSEVEVTSMIDAFLPPRSVEAEDLIGALRRRGTVRPFRGSGGRPTGSVDVNPADSALISASGAISSRIHCLGVPTEDARVFTIIAPIPDSMRLSPVIEEVRHAVAGALRRLPHARPVSG